MTAIKDIILYLDTIAPPEQKDEVDNIGLMVGSTQRLVSKAILCLDVTKDVIKEAKDVSAQLIISHHPFIFRPISNITDQTLLGSKILDVIKNDISVFSAHTNLDSSEQGINAYIAELLELKNIKRFDIEDSEWQGGRIGDLPKILTVKELADKLQKILKDDTLRTVGSVEKEVKKVAFISGGAGKTEYLNAAISQNADCYISADFMHHVMLEAYEKDFALIICSHYYMERVILSRLKKMLEKVFCDVEFVLSKTEKNPVNSL
jgi:dinuclear metal center YbgI/SA1388 family protein